MNRLLKIIHSRFLQHLFFWSIAWYLMLRLFSISSETTSIDYIYTSIFLLPVAASVYLNILVLIPRLLSKSRYLLYLVSLAITVAAAAWLNMLIFSDLIDIILPGYYFISYYDYTDLLKIFTAFTVITTLIELSKGWFRLAEARHKLVLLEKEHTEAELSSLKNQINPHFLFNSLNSLYSLVITKSETAPSYILKLADFLRYILYETSSELVTLEQELSSIRNYIEIQKLRSGDEIAVSLNVEGTTSGKLIAPLLFLPLIENAFKHGRLAGMESSYVEIIISITDNNIQVAIKNNAEQVYQNNAKESSGIGLDNLRKRLNKLYPGCHSLEIISISDTFTINLIVPLKDETQMSYSGR